MIRLAWCVALLVAVAVGACGGDDPIGTGGPRSADGAAEEAATEYTVSLGNAIRDTLRGNATFGRVLDPEENARHFVIRLASAFDFAGGVVMARRNTDLPEPGTYDLKHDSVAAASPDHFIIIYREGMLRDLQSVSGTLTLSTVTDSLIVGQFDATLRGYVSEGSRDLESADVHAVGRFRAERGAVGYIIGL